MGLGELGLLLLDLRVGVVKVDLGLVDLLAHLLGLGVQVVQMCVGLVELGLELLGGVCHGERGQAGQNGSAKGNGHGGAGKMRANPQGIIPSFGCRIGRHAAKSCAFHSSVRGFSLQTHMDER